MTMCSIRYPTMFEFLWIVRVLWAASLVIRVSGRKEEFVREHYQYMGQYYAGHGQFPWVVEIRTQRSEDWTQQEEWSIGNLIGPKFVLSTCNAVATFEQVADVSDRYVVVPKPFYQYKVMYSPDYPYHGPKWYINRYAKWRAHDTALKTGTRAILKMSPHPFCNPRTLKYFWGIAQLGSEPIRPFRLFVNYAPAVLDLAQCYRQWYFFKSKAFIPALLATWGRDYSDQYSKQTMLFNFKLQYKVKMVEWAECQKVALNLGWATWNANLEQVNNTYCLTLWDPDNTMGAICDHDRGAPIVYEDFVIGMVVTGADIEHCSNLSPLPFVAQSLIDAQLYWTNVERHILSYYIDNKTHLFPGLTGLIQSSSPPRPNAAGASLIFAGLLLIARLFCSTSSSELQDFP